MLALKILGYMLLVAGAMVVVTLAIIGAVICYDMIISTDNCKGCPNYPEHCRRCKVYKHMDDEVKRTWLKEE